MRSPGLRGAALVLFTLSGLACSGSTQGSQSMACTDIGCVDGFTLNLSPASGKWASGSYVFNVTTPAGTSSCKGALPLPPCGTPAFVCSGPKLNIGESGCALPAEQQGFSNIDFPDGPASVALAIERDGHEIAKKSFTPTYATVSPNGPTCGPTCRQANATLSF